MPILRTTGRTNDERKQRRRHRRLRSIALLPSMATLGNLICGFAAIHFAALHLAGHDPMVAAGSVMAKLLPLTQISNLAIAGYLIFLSMFWDALDGQLARLTRRSSEFGAQLDSLADIVSFGAAPAFMMICLVSHTLQDELVTPISSGFWGRATWVMAATYVACAALRLARFNVETINDDSGHSHFRGLPSPAAGFALVAFIVLHEDVLRVLASSEPSERNFLASAPAALVKSLPVAAMLLGLMMVSRIRYRHVTNAYLRGRRPFTHLVGAVFVVAVFLFRPQLTLATLAAAYTLSGPVAHVARWIRGSHPDEKPEASIPGAQTDDGDQRAHRSA